MDESMKFFAKPLDKNNIFELKYNLNQLMDNLNEQNDCVRYVKNCLKSERMNQELVYSKLMELLNKFEELINNEMRTINTFLIDISNKKLIEINEVLRNRYEEIRNNFNKIVSNLNKMLDSNPEISEIKDNYYSNRTPILGANKSQKPAKSRKDSTDERRSKINDGDSVEEAYTQENNLKTNDNFDNLESQISTLMKNVNVTGYKAKTSSLPKKGLSKNASASNITAQKEDKIKNIKTFHNEKVYFQNLQSFLEELEHIKDFCRNLQKTQQENCLVANERKNFEKMKSDVIKISSDVNILREEFQEIHSIFKQITTRISALEDENNVLKNQNKSLIKNIKQAASSQPRNDYISIENEYNTDGRQFKPSYFNSNDMPNQNLKSTVSSNNNNTLPNEMPSQTNNMYMKNRTGLNTMDEPNMSGLSDLNSMQNNSSIEMNMNLKNNTQNVFTNPQSKKRFLIPK